MGPNSTESSNSDNSPPGERSYLHSTEAQSPDSATGTESMFFASFNSDSTTLQESLRIPSRTKWGRAILPVTMFSRNNFSLWSILKQCIGRELSKITMPVVFNEPLSFLQRMCENIEYYDLLEKANNCTDPLKRMEYVTIFAVSSLSSNHLRLAKPFNPLLGETFEFVRDKDDIQLISEQVSHHPPVSAFHVRSKNFTFYGAVQPKLKLWGRSVEAIPEGTLTLRLANHNEVYTWTGMKCCIHNIIVGKLWMEQTGVMQIACHTNGLSASINFKPAGWFQRDLNVVEGFIYDKHKTKQRFIFGRWCDFLRSTDVEYYEDYLNSREQGAKLNNNEANSSHDFEDSCSEQEDQQEIPSELVWKEDPRPEYSPDYYSFTSFAISLNELKEDMETTLPRTDCRFRPDIRKLEEGDIDGAAFEKNRLEEKQREARKRMKKERSEWCPLWFEQTRHPYTNEDTWIFKENYWNRNFDICPSIF